MLDSITMSEAMKKLECSYKTINNLINNGSLYAYKDGRKWIVSNKSLNNLINTRVKYPKIKKRLINRTLEISKKINKDDSYNAKFWKNQDIKIDWDFALKKAIDKFYKERTIESAIYLQEVQRLYKIDDIDGYLNLLENGINNMEVKL